MADPNNFLSSFNKERRSPIKDDSELMRSYGDSYLQNLVRAKSPILKVISERGASNAKSPIMRKSGDNYSA